MTARDRNWTVALGVIAAFGLALRSWWVLASPHYSLGGDAYYYHYQANLLATGHGFVDPFNYYVLNKSAVSAYHPPLWVLYLTAFSVLGMKTWTMHRLAGSLLGAATIVLVGLVGRRVGGRRVGLIAAGLTAIYPLIWINDVIGMSEAMVLSATALVLLLAYRLIEEPTVGRTILLGAACGLAILSRSEQVLLIAVFLLPFFVLLRRVDLRRRLTLLGIAWLAAGIVLAPWVGRNLVTFHHPVLLSTNLDTTLVTAYCAPTFDPHSLTYGFWNMTCLPKPIQPTDPRFHALDESDVSITAHHVATRFINRHLSDIPGVMMARVGRTWDLYRRGDMLRLGVYDGRPLTVSQWGRRFFVALVPLAIAGAVILWRRRVMLVPLLALPALVTVSALFIYGDTRFRAPAELSVVVLAAVALEAVARRVWPSPARSASAHDAPRLDLSSVGANQQTN